MTKHIILSFAAILCLSATLHAQNNITEVLNSIEDNNTTLKALRESTEAQKLYNTDAVSLADPEVGFNYLWGSPKGTGNRTDISITQSFDLPTLLGINGKVAKGRNSLLEWQYRQERKNILLEAKRFCIELIYCNALALELHERLMHAETIAAGYAEKLQQGDANRLGYNKAQLNLTTVRSEISRLQVDRNELSEQLRRLNGGQTVVLTDTAFAPVSMPDDFDSWFTRAGGGDPRLGYARQEVEVGKRELSQSRASWLPAISAGYMSEKAGAERLQGISLGISVPLWANKGRVKQSKMALHAAELREQDSGQQFYHEMRILFNRTSGLQEVAASFRQALETANNAALLERALDSGEISLLDYMAETAIYYDAVNQALQAERDAQLSYAELSAMEL